MAAPTVTTDELFTADGVALNTYAWNVTNRGGRWSLPAIRTGNNKSGGRHGYIWTARKVHDAGAIVLSMWVQGSNPDGSMPADLNMRRQVRANADALARTFAKRYSLIHLVQTEADGSQRECYAEVIAGVNFTTMGLGARAEFAVELVIPAVFWQDVAQVTESFPVPASGTILTLDAFAAATAPLEDLLFTLNGPGASPQLTDPASGATVQYGGTLAAGQAWTVDSGSWLSSVSGSNVIGQTVHSGADRLLPLAPQVGGPQVQVSGSGFTGATSLTVAGRRKYYGA